MEGVRRQFGTGRVFNKCKDRVDTLGAGFVCQESVKKSRQFRAGFCLPRVGEEE